MRRPRDRWRWIWRAAAIVAIGLIASAGAVFLGMRAVHKHVYVRGEIVYGQAGESGFVEGSWERVLASCWMAVEKRAWSERASGVNGRTDDLSARVRGVLSGPAGEIRYGFTRTEVIDGERVEVMAWPARIAEVTEYGFPVRCGTYAGVYHERVRPAQERLEQVHGRRVRATAPGWVIPTWLGHVAVPEVIGWAGLAINVVVLGALGYAAVVALPGVVARWFIRWARRHGGRCVACGYDLRGMSEHDAGVAACPECGTDFRCRATAATG